MKYITLLTLQYIKYVFRILEVNGKMTLATSKEEMNRLLTVCPSRAEIVVNRLWTPPPTPEDFLRRENLRLTHRISYLEDQVAELLLQKEKSSVPLKLPKFERKPMEVFQKGSQVTVLQTAESLKGEPHLTTVTINAPSKASPPGEQCKIGDVVIQNGIGKNLTKGCNITVGPSEKYHEVESYHGHQPKHHGSSEKIKALSKKYEKDEFSSTLTKNRYKNDCDYDEDDQKVRGAKVKLSNLKNCIPVETTYSLSDLERPTRKGNSYYSRVVDYSSETSCPKYRPHKDRSVKSLDLDGYEERSRHKERHDGEPAENGKPTPPKKPIRLSIHRATSLQNVETGYSLHNAIRKMKRSHKSEAPQPPVAPPEVKVNGNDESHSVNGDFANSRTSSRAESWVNHSDGSQSPFRWPGQHHRPRTKVNEKWC